MINRIVLGGGALIVSGLFMGHIIAGVVFFGVLTAASLIVLIETASKSFKMRCGQYGFVIDLVMYALSCIAIAKLGVTIAGGLGVASLIFTLYRVKFLAPWYREAKATVVKTSRGIFSYIAQVCNWVLDKISSLFKPNTIKDA